MACFSRGTVSLQRSDCMYSAVVVSDHRRDKTKTGPSAYIVPYLSAAM